MKSAQPLEVVVGGTKVPYCYLLFDISDYYRWSIHVILKFLQISFDSLVFIHRGAGGVPN